MSTDDGCRDNVDPKTAANGQSDIGEAATLLLSEESVGLPGLPDRPTPTLDGVGDVVKRDQVFGALFGQPNVRRFGRYIVLDVLGQGGMGVVFKAYDEQLDRPVAIKVLHQGLGEGQTTRLKREAQAMAKLSHPNVVQVYEVGEVEGQVFVAMELVKGKTPREWMRQDPRPDWRACVEIFGQLGAGLAAAHKCGLVHRDFKPGNAVIDEQGRARVLDFGLARQGKDDADGPPSLVQRARTDPQQVVPLDVSLTKTGAVLGTPAYMPPEQMNGHEANARSDQFSFCVSLYQAVYGERPYEGSSLVAMMVSMQGGVVRPTPKGSKVPATLREVLLRGLATDPAKRWPSMEALLAELHAIMAPRFRKFVGIGVAVVLVLIAAATFVVQRQSEKLSEQEGVITKSKAQLAQQVKELQEKDRRLTGELAAQKGLRATMLAKDAGHELEAVSIAVEAFGGIDAHADSIPAPVFEGLTHALAGIDRGVALRGHEARVIAVAISPDGEHIATTSGDQTVQLWDANSGAPLRTFEGHTDEVHAVAFSVDGARLATTGEDKTARIWDSGTGEPLGSFEHQGAVRAVAFSPNGTRIATASDDAAWLWHEGSDAIVVPLLGHTGRVRSVAFSPDGTRLWTASEDQTARVWDTDSGALVQALEGHTGPVFDVVVSLDGRRIATASGDRTARLWDAATGRELDSFSHGERVYAVALSPDGTQLATGTFDDGEAHRWDVATGHTLGSFHHEDAVVDVAFSPGGHQLVTASWDLTARSWDLDPSKAVTTLQHSSRVDAVAFSPNGSRVATGSGDGTARVWDADSGAHSATLKGHGLDVLAVAFSPDGSRIATASWDGTARVFDASTATSEQTLEGHTGPVRAVVFSRDGSRIATASRDGTARVWDVATGEELRSLSHEGPVIDVMFAPVGEQLLTVGADDTARVWDAAERPLTTFPYEGPVTAVAFSGDGKTIAVAIKDYSVRSWNADTAEALETFGGHTAPVHAVVFSPDGTRLATGSEDGTARVWDATTGKQITAFPHQSPVSRVSFSADGTALVTANGDEMARVWALDAHAWLEWGCLVLDRRAPHEDPRPHVCSKATADAAEIEPPSTAEPVVAVTDVARPETITAHGVELVLIPGGTFMMGSPEGEGDSDERPQHELELDSFYLARTEVTNAQYALYLEANPDVHKPPGWEDERFNQPEQPVTGVSWHDAMAYCDWAGLKLPTEAQWEYAARAGTTTAFSFGDDEGDLERFGWYEDNSGSRERSYQHARSQSVGTKGANAYGLHDMHGNVWEWTRDSYDSYATSPRTGDGLRHEPVDVANCVIRGGSWDNPADVARSASRHGDRPAYRSLDIGFRPAQGIH